MRVTSDADVIASFNLYPGAQELGRAGDNLTYIYYWTEADVDTVKSHYEMVFPRFQGDQWLITAYTRDGSPTAPVLNSQNENLCRGHDDYFNCIDLILIDLAQNLPDIHSLSMAGAYGVELPAEGTLIIYNYTTGRF